MSLLLAIDTATDVVGVALYDGDGIVARSWEARQRQTETVLAGIDGLLGEAGRTIREVGAVAVLGGPGSFSGLRVGMSVAKGLVLAGDVAVIGVPTLLATAVGHVGRDRPVVAVVEAGRRRLVWGLVADGEPEPTIVGEMTNGTAEELRAYVGGLEGAVSIRGDVPEQLGDLGVSGASDGPDGPDGRVRGLARVGFGRWARGEVDDPVRLEPVYLHVGVAREGA